MTEEPRWRNQTHWDWLCLIHKVHQSDTVQALCTKRNRPWCLCAQQPLSACFWSQNLSFQLDPILGSLGGSSQTASHSSPARDSGLAHIPCVLGKNGYMRTGHEIQAGQIRICSRILLLKGLRMTASLHQALRDHDNLKLLHILGSFRTLFFKNFF